MRARELCCVGSRRALSTAHGDRSSSAACNTGHAWSTARRMELLSFTNGFPLDPELARGREGNPRGRSFPSFEFLEMWQFYAVFQIPEHPFFRSGIPTIPDLPAGHSGIFSHFLIDSCWVNWNSGLLHNLMAKLKPESEVFRIPDGHKVPSKTLYFYRIVTVDERENLLLF